MSLKGDDTFQLRNVQGLCIIDIEQSASKLTLGGGGPIVEYYNLDDWPNSVKWEFYG